MNKRERLSKLSYFNTKGFSLIEVVVATGIGTIISAGIAAVFVFALEQFTVLVEQNAAEESLLWASYNTRSLFSQAIDIQVKNDPVTASINGAKGQLISNYSSTGNGTIKTIAIFGREMGTSSTSSNLYPTSVFFIEPNTTAVGSAKQPWGGTLIFDLGDKAGSSMWPTMSDLWFDRISEFRITDVECAQPGVSGNSCDGENAKSATFILKARYFKTAKKSNWYFADPGGGTSVMAPYRDIEMTIKVGFRNNVILDKSLSKVGGTIDERLHGGLYFFKMSLPPLSM